MKTKGVSRDNIMTQRALHTQSAEIQDRKNGEAKPKLPEAPPNYRGMIYDIADSLQNEVLAEGLNRLAGEDADGGYSKRARQRESGGENKGDAGVFAERDAAVSLEKGDDSCVKGLKSLAKEMEQARFSPEDVLICAMIILMLNSASEDDILMILVLMMLL